MEEFLPYMTNDFSVGLYSESCNDIYHSAFGALSEAYEKFILPLNINELMQKKNKINVLDICYGIGYNTKVFLNEIINNNYNEQEINIDCVDINSFLFKISPFISSEIKFWNRILGNKKLYKNIKKYSEANKIIKLKKKQNNITYKLNKIINIILYNSIFLTTQYFDYNFLNNELIKSDDFIFFDKNVLSLHKNFAKKYDKLYQNQNKSPYLHNIYYSNISKRYNLDKYKNINIKFFNNDIRNFVKNTNKKYDIIFLDGFTPQKCPCIWSEDFIEYLFKIINNDGQLVTYNQSAVVRAALLNAGFYIGNTLNNKNKTIGTLATKKITNIKNQLSPKQLGLLSTKAGIPFRDKNLCLSNDIILLNRKNEVSCSTLESSSQFMKRWKK